VNVGIDRFSDQAFQEKLEEALPFWLEEMKVPGAALAALQNGRLAYSQGFGTANVETGQPVTADTIFEAASLSKPVVAYAVLQLVNKGLLELDRPLLSYMPDGRIPVTLLQGEEQSQYPPLDLPLLNQITCRHVLSHTTGFPNWPPPEAELAIHFPSGSRFSYSGMAYAMVQTIIKVLSGQLCQDYIQANIFDPFDMAHSTFLWDGEKNWPLAVGHDKDGQPVEKTLMRQMIAGASLHCSTADFARFLSVILKSDADSPFHLPVELTREMTRSHIQVNNSAPWHDDWPKLGLILNKDVGWGLGWGTQQTAESLAIWHWGDNGVYRNFVLAFPDRENGLIIMTNSKNGANLYERILRELVGGEYPALDWLDAL
jgi:CubicO group peptidase (beta-lactamase class C family)